MGTGLEVAAWAAVAAMAAGTGYQVYAGQQAASQQEEAQQQAKSAAKTQEQKAEEATNRANQKRPDTMAILSAAQQAGKGGASGTMLTGPTGISPDALNLGKSSLLGG